MSETLNPDLAEPTKAPAVCLKSILAPDNDPEQFKRDIKIVILTTTLSLGAIVGAFIWGCQNNRMEGREEKTILASPSLANDTPSIQEPLAAATVPPTLPVPAQ